MKIASKEDAISCDSLLRAVHLDVLKGNKTVEKFALEQLDYHAEIVDTFKEINTALKRNNLANRVLARVINNHGDKIYRLFVLLICGLLGVKTLEFLAPILK